MKRGNTRPWYIVLALCLVALLVACGGTPTPQAESTAQPSNTSPPDPTSTATATTAPAATTALPTVPAPTPTPTPTPTPEPVVLPPTSSPSVASRCQGLAGTLELQVLAGPAEAVGLEPVAVGDVPFQVMTQQAPYEVQGQAPISYEAKLEKQWGTYTVNMDLNVAVSGECKGDAGSEGLDLALDMSGEQLVVVDADGFHGEYPWSGNHTLNLSFPLQEGATAQGEGWVVVLHLGSP